MHGHQQRLKVNIGVQQVIMLYLDRVWETKVPVFMSQNTVFRLRKFHTPPSPSIDKSKHKNMLCPSLPDRNVCFTHKYENRMQ